MVVVELKQTSPERYRVCFEDGTEVRSTLSAIAELRVSKGKDLDDAQMEMFRTASERSLTLERSVELLSYRQMSGKELRDKLLHKGISPDTAEYCCGRLKEMGLIDEERYAAAVARHYAAKGYGAGRVRAELSKRGIGRDLWENALDSMPDSDEKLDRLVRSKLVNPCDKEQIRKVSASLYRRGYSWTEIRNALERYNTEIDLAEPEDI